MPIEGPWAARRARAVELLHRTPHAEEILAFYVGLVEIQERVADRVPAERWLALVRSSPGDETPRLRLDDLPVEEIAPGFEDFLGRVAEVGTDLMTEGARALLSADEQARTEVLSGALRASGAEHGDDFYARAYLEPVVTTLALADSRQPPRWDASHCFECGRLPQVAVLRDRPDAMGSRTLVCSLCGTEWRFRRLTCPHCGETAADRLPVHTAESVPHVRIDECGSCRRYLKTVDLRVNGDAVPVVDEVATVELDVWAREQGLTKLRTNVLGF